MCLNNKTYIKCIINKKYRSRNQNGTHKNQKNVTEREK